MRIALVTQAYYPIRGGVTEHVWHLARELEQRGHIVTIITGQSKLKDDRGRRVIRLGYQIPIVANGASVSVTVGWKLGRALQRIEQREKFDLVHIQCPLDPGLPLVASKIMRTKKVGTYHTYTEPKKWLELFRPILTDAVKKIDRHVAVSAAAKSVITNFFHDLPVTIIPNGVDVDRFSPTTPPRPELRDGVPTILYVGRMDPRKGAKYLLLAIPHLAEVLPHFRVVIVGGGWMQRYYDAYLPKKFLPFVQFAGAVPAEALASYYRSADIFCSPATGGESFGIVLLEAMASGIPLVASDIVGYRDVITPGVEGLLVPPRSPRHLAEAIATLVNDPAQRKAMGEAGRKKALTYAWPKVVDQLEAVYQQLLAS